MKKLTKEQVFKKLRGYARRWGGDILQVDSSDSYDGHFESAPFTGWDLGCDHKTKRVVFSSHAEPEGVEAYATGIIHEMAHIFVCKRAPNKMLDGEDEFNFFGWEVILAERVGLTRSQFYAGNPDYTVTTEADDIRGLLSGEYIDGGKRAGRRLLTKIVAERVRLARTQSLIKNGRPVTIR